MGGSVDQRRGLTRRATAGGPRSTRVARSAAGSCDRASRGDTPTTSGICLVARYASTFAGSLGPSSGLAREGRRKPLVDAHEVPNKPHVVVHEGRMLRE